MKFIKKFTKEKIGKIFFSFDKTEIFDGEKIFQTIDSDNVLPSKELEIYIKKLKGFSKINIYIEEGYFKTVETEIVKDEVSEENIEKYMEYEIKGLLNKNSIDEYFLKYFKTAENSETENYVIYIFEREFVEDLIEFSLKNRLKIGKIILNEEQGFFIDDYNLLLHKNSNFSLDKRGIIIISAIFLGFVGIKGYNISLEKKILNLEKQMIIAENSLNETKEKVNLLQEDVLRIENEIEKFDVKKELIEEKILRILKIMPEEISAENIYYEKGFLSIGGISTNEISLFVFLENLEKDREISSVKYDYIMKKENNYEFFLEIKV